MNIYCYYASYYLSAPLNQALTVAVVLSKMLIGIDFCIERFAIYKFYIQLPLVNCKIASGFCNI